MTFAQNFSGSEEKYLQYDFAKRKKRRGDVWLDRKIAKENLLLFKKICDNVELDFILLYGTLLGAIRDQDFIIHDYDTDVGIFDTEVNKLLKAKDMFLTNGFRLIRTENSDNVISLMRNDEYIDILVLSPFTQVFKKYYACDGGKFDIKYLTKLSTIDLFDTKFTIPNHSIELLEKNYGKDWMTPIKGEEAMDLGIKNLYRRIKRKIKKGKYMKNYILVNYPNFYKRLLNIKHFMRTNLGLVLFKFKKKKNVLLYVGGNVGDELYTIFFKFQKCYVFEANPNNYKILKNRFKSYPNVNIYNNALTDVPGILTLNLSGVHNNAAGSLNKYSEKRHVKMVGTIDVIGINLYDFLLENKINYIDEYVSDIEGYDFIVLNTLKEMLQNRKIEEITCEVIQDNQTPYIDTKNYRFTDFNELLNDNYKLIATGDGYLEDGIFNKVPTEWNFMDHKWKLK